MQTTLQRSAFPAPARLGRGLVGATDELIPLCLRRVPSRKSLRRLSWFCFLVAAALGAMFVFTGCAATRSGPRQSVLAGIAAGLGSLLSNATGSLSYSNGPVEVGITSDGKTISRSYRLRDGKNVIELRRGGAAR